MFSGVSHTHICRSSGYSNIIQFDILIPLADEITDRHYDMMISYVNYIGVLSRICSWVPGLLQGACILRVIISIYRYDNFIDEIHEIKRDIHNRIMNTHNISIKNYFTLFGSDELLN